VGALEGPPGRGAVGVGVSGPQEGRRHAQRGRHGQGGLGQPEQGAQDQHLACGAKARAGSDGSGDPRPLAPSLPAARRGAPPNPSPITTSTGSWASRFPTGVRSSASSRAPCSFRYPTAVSRLDEGGGSRKGKVRGSPSPMLFN